MPVFRDGFVAVWGMVITMKKPGIIGGIGPASTLDYYNGIINGYRERTIGEDYPTMVIDSVNMTEMLGYVSGNNRDALISLLLRSIRNLAAAGADFAAIASNTPHIVFDSVEKQSPIPLISIVEETCKYARSMGCKRVAVLGTSFTMSSGLYTSAFARYGMEAFVPDNIAQSAVQDIIFPHLEDGMVIPSEKAEMLGMAVDLIVSHDADALVLGCTELPLMIRPEDLQTTVLNTTQIHIRSILREMTS